MKGKRQNQSKITRKRPFLAVENFGKNKIVRQFFQNFRLCHLSTVSNGMRTMSVLKFKQ
jgi:hypothetical protein